MPLQSYKTPNLAISLFAFAALSQEGYEVVGSLRAMTSAQLPPNCKEAISALRGLLAQCTYPDLDVSNEDDVDTLLARRQVAEASLQRLEIELGFRKPPIKRRQKRSIRAKGKPGTR